jgi:hypothetical protein
MLVSNGRCSTILPSSYSSSLAGLVHRYHTLHSSLTCQVGTYSTPCTHHLPVRWVQIAHLALITYLSGGHRYHTLLSSLTCQVGTDSTPCTHHLPVKWVQIAHLALITYLSGTVYCLFTDNTPCIRHLPVRYITYLHISNLTLINYLSGILLMYRYHTFNTSLTCQEGTDITPCNHHLPVSSITYVQIIHFALITYLSDGY